MRGPYLEHPYSFEWDGKTQIELFSIEISDEEAEGQIEETIEDFLRNKGLSGDELGEAVEETIDTVTLLETETLNMQNEHYLELWSHTINDIAIELGWDGVKKIKDSVGWAEHADSANKYLRDWLNNKTA